MAIPMGSISAGVWRDVWPCCRSVRTGDTNDCRYLMELDEIIFQRVMSYRMP